jgi:hypothetical protein
MVCMLLLHFWLSNSQRTFVALQFALGMTQQSLNLIKEWEKIYCESVWWWVYISPQIKHFVAYMIQSAFSFLAKILLSATWQQERQNKPREGPPKGILVLSSRCRSLLCHFLLYTLLVEHVSKFSTVEPNLVVWPLNVRKVRLLCPIFLVFCKFATYLLRFSEIAKCRVVV